MVETQAKTRAELREAGGGGEGEAVERGDLGRKVGLGKQCLSFNIIFLAISFSTASPPP